ncbi:MAG: tetratricopeptide repeat protein, partial [Alphaproteobacteria bacterium]
PDKPSLAVLPFANMSGDPEQEYFSDGIAEDIITDLSRFGSLFVIARNSSFQYKGRSPKIQRVGRELGVRYVVEGSVRKAGHRVRITAQLIEAESGKHLWADRYDRDLDDIFTVQDEVTNAIVTAVEPTIGSAERDRVRRKPPESLDAWESYQRGLWSLYRFTHRENIEAQSFFRRAIELDSEFAPAHAGLAHAIYISVMLGFVANLASVFGEARASAQRAVTLDDDDALAHAMMGRIHLLAGDLDEAISACRTALTLNPNLALAHYGLGGPLNWSGRHEEAIVELNKAIRLSPRDPLMWHFLTIKAQALMAMEYYEEGLELARTARRQANAGVWAFSTEVVALAHLDRIEEAKLALKRARTIKSDFDLDFVANTFKRIGAVDYEYYLDGLKRAGLNECANTANS